MSNLQWISIYIAITTGSIMSVLWIYKTLEAFSAKTLFNPPNILTIVIHLVFALVFVSTVALFFLLLLGKLNSSKSYLSLSYFINAIALVCLFSTPYFMITESSNGSQPDSFESEIK